MTTRFLSRIGGIVLATAAVVVVSPACSQGEGEGRIGGRLSAPNCWTGDFDLAPDFFAAVPYREGLLLRLQRGSDFQAFSDGVSIILYDINQVRPDPAKGFAGRYGQPLDVGMPPEVTPPGVPIEPNPNPAPVSLTLYLQKSCRTENVALHAVTEVSVPTDGSCDLEAVMGSDPRSGCDPQVLGPAGFGYGRSTIAFTHVFNGKLDETTAAERLIEGCFDVYLADPREASPGGLGPPPRCRGHLRGNFSFFFERGRPSQPFP